MARNIATPMDEIANFCRRWALRKLALFGSVLRDDFTPESDVDVLVEPEPDVVLGLSRLLPMEEELSRILRWPKVELHTPNSLSPYFRDEVLAGAEVLYVET